MIKWRLMIVFQGHLDVSFKWRKMNSFTSKEICDAQKCRWN